MSKRNFILLIIVFILIVLGVLGYLYLQQNPNTNNGDDTGAGTNFINQFNPFGSGDKNPTTNTNPPPTDVSGYTPPAPEIKLKLTKVSSMPVAGFGVFSKERLKDIVPPVDSMVSPQTSSTTTKSTKIIKPLIEFAPALRYVERSSGNIYQTFADKIEEKKFSSTVIPKIYEAFFGNKGDSVVMRYLKGDARTIITFVGTLPKELLGADTSTPNEIKGTFLPEDVKDVSISKDSLSMFYLFDTGDNMIGTTLNFFTNKKVQLFDSPFTEWLSVFPNNKTITITTKPSSNVPGYMYAIDINKKNMTKILGEVNGLTTLTSPDGKLVLYGDGNLSLNIYHTDTKTTDLLGVKTLPEKCTWGKMSDAVYCGVPKTIPSGQYPDSWYQGEASLEDQIWKIDMKTGNASIIADPASINGGEEIDSIKLALDEAENYLFFVNKKDSYLWELNLK